MNLSEYTENLIAEWVRGNDFPASPTTLYLALSNVDPLDDGSGILEPNLADGYARQVITFDAPVTVLGDSTRIVSNNVVTFGPATVNWPPVAFGAIYDENDNLLFQGPLTNQRVVPMDDTIEIEAGSIQLELHIGFSTFFATAILNWLRGASNVPAPTETYFILSTQDPKEDGSGLIEPNNTFNYIKQEIEFGLPNFVSGIGTTIDQSLLVLFGPATVADWPTVTHGAVIDQNDNQIFQGPLATPKTLVVDDTLPIPPGSMNILVR